MHIVRGNVVQYALVVGNEQNAKVRATQSIYTFGYYLECVDIQTGVCLVHKRDFWFEQGHLENLSTFLFATREAIVDGTVDEAIIYFEQPHLLLKEFTELTGWYAFAFAHFTSWILPFFQRF